MKIIYIAGPLRASTAWATEKNIRVAEDYGLIVANLGLVPLIPHSMYRFFSGAKNDRYWLAATVQLLQRCDAVLMLPHWNESEGSKAEFAEASRINLPVFFCDHPELARLKDYADANL